MNQTAKAGGTGKRGFSLVELIIAIALVAIVMGIFVVGLPSLTKGLGEPPLPEILHKSVRDARYHAGMRKEQTRLIFDEERSLFIVLSENGEELSSRKSGYTADDRIEVTFEQFLPFEGIRSRGREQRVEIPHVRFHPDHSSTPFVATIMIEGDRTEHRYDPFSDLEIEEE